MKDLVAEDSLTRWHFPRLPRLKIPEFQLHTPGAPGRDEVEIYIRDRFWEVHHAHINHFLPSIISLRCGGVYSAAVGLAPAGDGKLFSETYLSGPVDQVISGRLGVEVARNQIVEIGNLVSTWKGSSLLLFIVIAELIERLGYQWLVFTATAEVRRLLAHLHYSPIVLTEATPQVLPDGGASWGDYYANQPQVMCGDIRPAITRARKNSMYRATLAVIDRQLDRLCEEYLSHRAKVAVPGESIHE